MSDTEQELACLHADVMSALFRVELKIGVAEQQARANNKLTRMQDSLEKRDTQSAIFGVSADHNCMRLPGLCWRFVLHACPGPPSYRCASEFARLGLPGLTSSLNVCVGCVLPRPSGRRWGPRRCFGA